jgi:hypothetical protein
MPCRGACGGSEPRGRFERASLLGDQERKALMTRFLEKHLKIYAHETNRFMWISAICFVIFFVFAIFRTFVDTAFLKRYGPQYIPLMLVINALITFVIMGVVDRLSKKFHDYFLLAFLLGGYAISTGILYFTVQADYSISYPILYQLMHLLDSVLLVYLWNMAGDLFDARQGKRIFPLITACQVLGTTLGSFLTKPLTLAIGENPTLLVFGGTCLVTGIYLKMTGSGLFGPTVPKSVSAKGSSVRITEVPRIMIKYPIVRYLIITGLIPNILLPIFLYQFNVIANQTFPSEQSLISFLSIFRGMTTMTTFVLLFFMGRLYSSMGLTNASLVHPINFSILFTSLTAFFNIYVASYGQFSVILIQRAIAGPVNKILYSIIPSELVSWSRTFIRGTVLKIGMLAGALLMIALKPVLSARMLSPIAAVLAVYWVVETLIFRKHYKRILKQVIVEKQIDFDEIESIRGADPAGGVLALASVPMEDRPQEGMPAGIEKRVPDLDPDVALKLLDDASPQTRAEAAASFAASRDVRAVAKLVDLLGDTDDDVRQAAIEALMNYRHTILPFLEVSLTQATPRARQGILEVIRLSGLTEFEMTPFLGSELTRAYGNLIALRGIQSMDNNALSLELLRRHLKELNEEILSLIFYALWVSHADMRLMYEALKSETASLAVELVETSIRKEFAPYLIPLIEDIPIDEKIERGKKLLPLIRNETMDRVLTLLADSDDPVTRMLALFVIGDQVHEADYIPIVQSHLNDEEPDVRQLAEYALKRCTDEVADMPDIIERITRLKAFGIFEGMGVRELHAIASVVHVERFATGDVMIKEGEENSSIYLVIAGSVTIYEGYGTENQREKVTIGAGSFLGELSLFTRQAPNATCVAAEPTDAYVLRHHQFQEIMRVYPQIGINLCRFFTMKLRQLAY